MIRRLFACSLLAATCTGAVAQTPLERSLERCQSIADSLLRLRCYDALKPETRSPAQSTRPSVPAESTAPTAPAESAKPTTPAESTKPPAPAESTKPTTPADGTKPTTPAEGTKPTEPTETGGFHFQGGFDGTADCTVTVATPWFRRSVPVSNVPVHSDVTGILNPDKIGAVDLTMTIARSMTNTIHFGGTLGQQVPAPGGTARGEITSPNHLRLSWDLPNNVIIVEVDVTGQSCTATVNFQLKPGKTYYTLHDGRRLYGCGKPRVSRTWCHIR